MSKETAVRVEVTVLYVGTFYITGSGGMGFAPDGGATSLDGASEEVLAGLRVAAEVLENALSHIRMENDYLGRR